MLYGTIYYIHVFTATAPSFANWRLGLKQSGEKCAGLKQSSNWRPKTETVQQLTAQNWNSLATDGLKLKQSSNWRPKTETVQQLTAQNWNSPRLKNLGKTTIFLTTDGNWRKLTETDANWRKLTETDANWRKLTETDGNWRKLTETDGWRTETVRKWRLQRFLTLTSQCVSGHWVGIYYYSITHKQNTRKCLYT
jgi:hypothetical protein